MQTLKILVLSSVFSSAAFAISDPCNLQSKALPANLKMSEAEITEYKAKLARECELTQKYRNLKKTLKTDFNLAPEQVTEYQAMRFVRRVNFEDSKKNNIPVQLTYQIKNETYAKPISERSSIIWDNWIEGIKQLIPARALILSRKVFGFENLRRVHIGFFKLSDEVGDTTNQPDQGHIKPAVDNDNYWWTFSTPQESQQTKNMVNQINAHYQQMGLIDSQGPDYLTHLLNVKRSLKRQPPERAHVVEYADAIYSGDSRGNPQHLQRILNFMNSLMVQALKDAPLVWQGQLITPMQLAFITQQFYVQIHAFSEGNGRTSRFLQELILTSFDMPHGSSGDLMDIDVLSTNDDYYNQALSNTVKLVNTLQTCTSSYGTLKAQTHQPITRVSSQNLNYSCRIL